MVSYKQAAAIPYRFNNDNLQILLITSRNGKKWIIPKGIIEIGDNARQSAERETLEEAGVIGQINGSVVGEYEYKKWAGVCMVKVFPLLVESELEDWEEKEIRSRKWFEADEALKKVKPKKLQKLVRKFIKSIKKQVNTE